MIRIVFDTLFDTVDIFTKDCKLFHVSFLSHFITKAKHVKPEWKGVNPYQGGWRENGCFTKPTLNTKECNLCSFATDEG